MGESPGAAHQWVATDYRFQIPGNLERVPRYIGEHLWTWRALFRASPGAEHPMLDSENLIRVAGIVCHYCGREYDRGLAGRFCQGGPR